MADLIDSASILVIRDGEAGLEVLMIKRHVDIDFAGGAYVFPGGKVDADDLELAEHIPSFPVGYSELVYTAFREVFEESGLILGSSHNADQYRADLLSGEISFQQMIKTADVNFDVASIVPYARWVTPRIYPKRFDTRFYMARAPIGQIATPDGREATEAMWVQPIDFIDQFKENLMFPTVMNLKLLAQSSSVEEAFSHARARKIVTIEPRIVDGKRVIDPAAGYGEIDQKDIHQG